MSSGIFSLNEAHNEQVTGDWSKASEVWMIGSPVIVSEGNVGYVAGGSGNGDITLSTVERIDFTNDTSITIRGSLSANRYNCEAVGLSLIHI